MSKIPSFNSSKTRSKVLFFLLAFVIAFVPLMFNFPAPVQAATTLVTYPAPAGFPIMNTTYTVQVRVPGGAWQNVDVYNTTVGVTPASNASLAYFDTDGPVDLSITYNSGTVTSAAIHPTSAGLTPAVTGNTMTFSISGPTKLSVEVNGNVNTNLHLFVNPLEVNPPSPTDPNVIYLGPGVHNQSYTVPSGKTLYLAGGGVINGNVMFQSADNAKFIGRGMLSRPNYGGLVINFSNNITVDGIIVNDYGNAGSGGTGANIGNSSNVLLNNVKWFSYKKWTDGINVYGSNNVTINDAFFRTGDDAIAIYATRQGGGESYWGNTQNIKVSNTILMPDVAHPINIGTHGDPTAPGGGVVIDNVRFENIDILTHNTLSCSRALNIGLISGDGNLITNATFDNIRIEDVCDNGIFEIGTVDNGWTTGPGRGLKNVYFKNVSYTGTHAEGSKIYGWDSSRLAQDITFENLKINGNVISNAAAGNITIGNHTSNVNFIASGGTAPSVTPFPPVTPINLALNKSASSDSSQSGNPASSGNDSSTATRWSANDGNTGHSWTVDLGSSMRITDGSQVKWEQSGKVYKYKIETSNDNTNWTMKVDKTSNTSTVQTQTDNFKADARYVKITVTGLESGVWASFYDFKVLGEQWNLAMGKTASSDSTMSGFPASNAADGNETTRWSANDGNTGHWLKVDLGYVKKITHGTQVLWPTSGSVYQYKVETSIDNTNWTQVVDKTTNTSTDQVQNDYFTANARYVRITVTGLPSGVSAGISDFKVFGDPTDLALGKTATADSSAAGNPASNGNDGDTTTAWSAADALTGHTWTVDLGKILTINNGTQVVWAQDGQMYRYTLDVSNDNVNWTTKINKGGNSNNSQVQNDYFVANARYVRVSVTGLPSGVTASIKEFKVFGETGDTVTMAQLPFDETSGTIAFDATSNGWNGTLVGGASRVAGKSGNAVDLSGASQYVALPTGVVSSNDKITVAAWVNLDTVSNWSRIFDFGSGTSTNMFLTPKNGANGKIRFAIKNNGSAEQIIDGQAALPTGGWHHVAVTLNGSTGTLYVDGAQVGSNNAMTLKPSDMGATTQNWIGRSQWSADPYLDGRVDDFRIYNRGLTASEVTHVMNGQTVLPIAEISFNETSGTTASDLTGNGWNGTLTGGASWTTGIKGNAVDLSGTSQYVALPAGVVSSANAITVAAWVNLDTVSKWMRIFDFGMGTNNYMYLTPKNDGATGLIRFGIKNGGTEQSITGTAALPTGGWHHVAVTLDGATGTIYVDGQKVGSGNINIRPSQLGTTTQNWIGRSQFSSDPYLDGRVDDFRIYSVALTDQEVAAVMNE